MFAMGLPFFPAPAADRPWRLRVASRAGLVRFLQGQTTPAGQAYQAFVKDSDAQTSATHCIIWRLPV